MSTTQSLPLFQANSQPDWALLENIDSRQLSETHLARDEPGSACRLTRGTGSLGSDNGALSVDAGRVVVNGTAHDIAEQSVDIPYGDGEPRRDVVYVNGDGEVTVRIGQPGPLVWDSELSATAQNLLNAHRPAPPDLVSTSGFVLGVVTVEANSATLPAQDCIHDCRIGAPSAYPIGGTVEHGHTVITSDWTGQEVVDEINNPTDGNVFKVDPGAEWFLPETLSPPPGTIIFGKDSLANPDRTFIKGFNGPLIDVPNFLSLFNVSFHGNKSDYSGHVAELTKSRDVYAQNCKFRAAAGDGWHQEDGFFNTFVGCRFQSCDGWGAWLGSSENPHNQWLGPCYIGSNGVGGVYQASYGRSQQMFAWIGDNGGPGIQFDDPNSQGGFVAFAFRGSIVNNEGPAYLATGGNQRNHRLIDTQIAGNAEAPDASLTDPVGHIQVESGSLGLKIEGGQAYGHSQLIQASDRPAVIVLESPSDVFKGSVDGSNLAFELRGSATVDGAISTERSGPLSRVYLSSSQSIPNETFTQVAFDATTSDALGGADTANGQIAIPVDGTYSLVANARFIGATQGSRVIARIDAGGSEAARADSHAAISGGGTITARVSDSRQLTSGDSVSAHVWQDTGGSLDLRSAESETFLAVTKTG